MYTTCSTSEPFPLEGHDDGIRWSVVLGLWPNIIKRLDNNPDTSLGGVAYRFQWERITGLIKVIPRGSHEAATDRFADVTQSKLGDMGISFEESLLGSENLPPYYWEREAG